MPENAVAPGHQGVHVWVGVLQVPQEMVACSCGCSGGSFAVASVLGMVVYSHGILTL